MDTRTRSIRILMFPWLAHGHISPFLQLAKSLAKRNFILYICSSPINLNPIKTKLSEKESISIKLVELHVPSTPDLPPHYHTTNGLPPHLMTPLKNAFDAARPAFSILLKTLKPDLLIYDFLQPWAPEEAYSLDIPAVLFFTTGAAVTSFVMHHWLISHNCNDDEATDYPFESMLDVDLPLLKSTDPESKDPERLTNCVQRSSDIVLIKTFRELEGKYIDYVSVLTQKRFVSVGPLVDQGGASDGQEKKNEIIEWLDDKEARSTVFASFGSEYFLSEREIEEVALGLEMSGLNFIWIVRFPNSDHNTELEQVMPKGFLKRVKGRGMVVQGWAPQGRILAHNSVGVFVSHCGWSSVMEGIYFGVPIVAVPMHLDQPVNARLVEEVGFGKEVVGELERGEVARKVTEVAVDEELRQRVEELRDVMRGKGGEEGIDGVVEEVVKLVRRREKLNLARMNSMEKFNYLVMNRDGLLDGKA